MLLRKKNQEWGFANMHKLPLQGVRICDFTQWQAGPQATLWLAVMGAEVIKIESRQHLDGTRHFPPGEETRESDPDRNCLFTSLNLSKKSCTLNLSIPEAVEIAKRITEISDVVVENFATGVIQRLGLSYADLKKHSPHLIMASISGLGATGPDKNTLAFAPTVHAFAGLISLTGYCDGEPKPMGAMWADYVGGFATAYAVLAALHHRERTGEGQYIDVAMNEVILSMIPEALMDYAMNMRVQGPRGNQDDIMAPHGCYRCRGEDKWVSIAVSNEEEWVALCNVLGNPDWTREERFMDAYSRWENQQELDKLIEQWTENYTAYDIMNTLQKAGVAAGPSVNAEELFNDRHLRDRGFFMEIDQPEIGTGYQVRLPWKVGDGQIGNYGPAPLIGEHNDYVFHELLNMPKEEISRLVKEKVIY